MDTLKCTGDYFIETCMVSTYGLYSCLTAESSTASWRRKGHQYTAYGSWHYQKFLNTNVTPFFQSILLLFWRSGTADISFEQVFNDGFQSSTVPVFVYPGIWYNHNSAQTLKKKKKWHHGAAFFVHKSFGKMLTYRFCLSWSSKMWIFGSLLGKKKKAFPNFVSV